MSTTVSSASLRTKSSTDTISSLANYLPTGTFLAFQSIAPLFTNNGVCRNPEKVVTILLIALLAAGVLLICFTDSIVVTSGKSYYGLVTSRGLYNPSFDGSSIEGVEGSFYNAQRKYFVNVFDFLHAIVTTGVFLTMVLLTPPVQGCFFTSIPVTLVKSIPVLVAVVAGGYFSIAPSPRKGLGYSAESTHDDLVHDRDDDLETTITTTRRPRVTTTTISNPTYNGTDTSTVYTNGNVAATAQTQRY